MGATFQLSTLWGGNGSGQNGCSSIVTRYALGAGPNLIFKRVRELQPTLRIEMPQPAKSDPTH